MKKKLILSLVIASLMLMSAGIAVAATKMTLIVNGKIANVDPVVIKGVTYVPVRAAGEMLGASVKYDASTRTVTVTGKEQANVGGSANSFNVDVTINNGPMTMKVSKVSFDPAYREYSFASETHAAIILDVTAENTSNDKLDWYVNQSQLVLSTKEQIENTLISDSMITSEFNGKVVKKGQIVFPVKDSKFEDITSMRLLVSYVIDDEYNRIADDKEAEIILK